MFTLLLTIIFLFRFFSNRYSHWLRYTLRILNYNFILFSSRRYRKTVDQTPVIIIITIIALDECNILFTNINHILGTFSNFEHGITHATEIQFLTYNACGRITHCGLRYRFRCRYTKSQSPPTNTLIRREVYVLTVQTYNVLHI